MKENPKVPLGQRDVEMKEEKEEKNIPKH